MTDRDALGVAASPHDAVAGVLAPASAQGSGKFTLAEVEVIAKIASDAARSRSGWKIPLATTLLTGAVAISVALITRQTTLEVEERKASREAHSEPQTVLPAGVGESHSVADGGIEAVADDGHAPYASDASVSGPD